MRKVLITGSEGFLGTHLQETLATCQNTDVWTLDIEDADRDKHFSTPAENFNRYSDFDVIYHLAAITSTRTCEEKQNLAWKVNVESTRNIVGQLGPSQTIVFSSSSHVYDDDLNAPKTEDDLPSPINYYGLTKLISEQLIRHYAKDRNFSHYIYRVFSIYGPHQPNGFLFSDVINKAQTQDKVRVRDGETKISPVFVGDVIETMINQQLPQDTYNICSECRKIKEVYQLICEGMDTTCTSTNTKKDGKYRCGSNSKISQYRQNWTSLEKGIEKTLPNNS